MPKGIRGFQKGHIVTKETKKKMSERMKGNSNPSKSLNVRRKISESRLKRKEKLGYLNSPETRKKMSKSHKGRKLSEEQKKKISLSLKGKKLLPLTKEHKQKIGLANKGKVRSNETRLKIGKALSGNKSYLWQGGKSFEKYTLDWTNTLRRSIRERDLYTCQVCKEPQGDIALSIHHIDYDKKNCNSDNLISLCTSCHVRTNINRDYWINYFKIKN